MEKEEVKKLVKELLDYPKDEEDPKKKPIVVVPPDGTKKTRLRIYAYGSDLGRISTRKNDSDFVLSKEEYLPYLKNENERKELKQLFEKYETNKATLLQNPRYWALALRAADEWSMKKKGNDESKERKTQTLIVKQYSVPDKARDWCVVDMQFCLKKETGIPDIVVWDYERNQFGLIELKYNNKSTHNMYEHFVDSMKVCGTPKIKELFNVEIRRRMGFLHDYILPQENERLKQYLNRKDYNDFVWFGFLFVAGGKTGAQKVVKELEKALELKDGTELENALESKDGWDKCRFRYVDTVDDLAKPENALCFGKMEEKDEFLK